MSKIKRMIKMKIKPMIKRKALIKGEIRMMGSSRIKNKATTPKSTSNYSKRSPCGQYSW
jgi:hypothetical protein